MWQCRLSGSTGGAYWSVVRLWTGRRSSCSRAREWCRLISFREDFRGLLRSGFGFQLGRALRSVSFAFVVLFGTFTRSSVRALSLSQFWWKCRISNFFVVMCIVAYRFLSSVLEQIVELTK